MKIEIKLPEWADERAIYIMAGIELVAFKIPEKNWQIKTSRCNMCGKCCMNLRNTHPFPIIDGKCIHLKKEPGNNQKWRCGLGIHRPFGCCVGIFTGDYAYKHVPECTEKYKEL